MKARRLDTRWLLGAFVIVAWVVLAGCGGSGDKVAEKSESANTGTPFGGFYIDGSVPDAPFPVGVTADHFNDLYGNSKELGPINGTEEKVGVIHSALPPMLGQTNPNGQVDYREVWAATNKVGSDIFLYFAWRRDANSGSGFIAWEFQQSDINRVGQVACTYPPDPATCNPWRNRQPGDFLLEWDQQGNSKVIYIRFFEKPAGVTTWNFGDPLVLGPNITLTEGTDYEAAYSTDGYYGEAAVNLSKAVFKPNTCVSIANVIPTTVTGNSDSADYKDTVLEDFTTTITNCGTLEVVKVTDPTGTKDLSFPFTVTRSGGGMTQYANGSAATYSMTGTLTGDASPATFSKTFTGVVEGTDFQLVEGTVTTGWAWVSTVCKQGTNTWTLANSATATDPMFGVVAGAKTTCTITNRLNQGAVRITKQAINKYLGSGLHALPGATFEVHKGSGTTAEGSGSCTTGLDGTCCIGELLFATDYKVVETAAPTGYKKAASQDLTINAVANCDLPVPPGANAPVAMTFENNPLYKLVFARQATFLSKPAPYVDTDGSHDILQAKIQCTDDPADSGTGAPLDPTAFTSFSRTRTFDDVDLSSTNTSDSYTFSCTVTVDP